MTISEILSKFQGSIEKLSTNKGNKVQNTTTLILMTDLHNFFTGSHEASTIYS